MDWDAHNSFEKLLGTCPTSLLNSIYHFVYIIEPLKECVLEVDERCKIEKKIPQQTELLTSLAEHEVKAVLIVQLVHNGESHPIR